jgi:hypothetical protein
VAHPCILITDILVGQLRWRAINFYNDIDNKSVLATLLSLDLDSTIPTIIMGDFNLHSRAWSSPDWTLSSTSARIEEWLATQTFSLLSQPGVPTHRGKNSARDSTIDLVWCNFATSIQGSFQGAHVDWTGSLGSDHALICTIASTPLRLIRHREDHTNRFDMDISAEEWEEWAQIFAVSIPPRIALNNPTTLEIDILIDSIYEAFNTACSATMKHRGNAPAFSAKWWNNECRDAVAALADAESTEERKQLGLALKHTVRSAKRDWANSYITEANIWEVAAWHHGRRSSHIPALVNHNGELTYDHKEMSSLLSERFFAEDTGNIPMSFPDDPPPRPTRLFPPFEKEELPDLLKQTAAKSAPGSLGIGWDLLKRGWPLCDDLLMDIYTACIWLGHHPARWKEATVVVIPKPNKSDYSLAKAHRPISLLETMSKLMEKAVAKRFQYNIVKENLIGTNQFGRCTHSSCLDAGLTLIHDVQTAHAAGLKAGILLFDVKGFFDNVNHTRMTARLTNMGFAPELVKWATSFLAERQIRLHFNNITSEERFQCYVCTPQIVGVSHELELSCDYVIISSGHFYHLPYDVYVMSVLLIPTTETISISGVIASYMTHPSIMTQ